MRVGLMGATGMVGTEMLRTLEERAFPVSELRVYASPRSAGRKLAFSGGDVTCEVLRPGCFDGLDLVIVDVDEPLSIEWSPQAAAAGAKVIDKLNLVAVRDPDTGQSVRTADFNPDVAVDPANGNLWLNDNGPNCNDEVDRIPSEAEEHKGTETACADERSNDGQPDRLDQHDAQAGEDDGKG